MIIKLAFLLTLFFPDYSNAQSDLDKIVSEFMQINQLSENKLLKLESTRLAYGVESKQWQRAYQKWDKFNTTGNSVVVTNLLCEIAKRDLNCTDFEQGESFSNNYLLNIVEFLEKNDLTNQTSICFYRNVFHKRIDISDSILKLEFPAIEEAMESIFRKSILTKAKIQAVESYLLEVFPRQENQNFQDWIAQIKSISPDQMRDFIRYAKSIDLMKEFPITELSTQLNYPTKSHVGDQFREVLKLDLTQISKGGKHVFNVSKWEPQYYDLYETFTNNDAVRQLLLTSMMCQFWQNFETFELNSSSFGRKFAGITQTPPTIALGFLEEYTLENFPIFFNSTETMTSLEMVLLAANERVYILPDPKSQEGHRVIGMHKIRYESIEFSTLENEILSSIRNASSFSDSMRVVLSDRNNIYRLESNPYFMLAIHSAIAEKIDQGQSTIFDRQLMPFSEMRSKEVENGDHAKIEREIDQTHMFSEFQKQLQQRFEKREIYGGKVILQIGKDHSFVVRYDGHSRNGIRKIQSEVFAELNNYGQLNLPIFTQLIITLPDRIPNQNDQRVAEIAFNNDVTEASFPGGSSALTTFIQNNIQYPEEAQKKGEAGRVHVAFIVEIDGSLSEVKILRSVSPSIDAEALRIVSLMPKWIPGTEKGKVTRARCRLPITFSLK